MQAQCHETGHVWFRWINRRNGCFFHFAWLVFGNLVLHHDGFYVYEHAEQLRWMLAYQPADELHATSGDAAQSAVW